MTSSSGASSRPTASTDPVQAAKLLGALLQRSEEVVHAAARAHGRPFEGSPRRMKPRPLRPSTRTCSGSLRAHMTHVLGLGQPRAARRAGPTAGRRFRRHPERGPSTPRLDTLWKKCDPWLGSMRRCGSVASTSTFGAGHLPPHDGDAEPRVGAAPPAEADQDVRAPRVHQRTVELRDLRRHVAGARGVEPIRPDVDDVLDVLAVPVAHRATRGQERFPGDQILFGHGDLAAGRGHRRGPGRARTAARRPTFRAAVAANSISTAPPVASPATASRSTTTSFRGQSCAAAAAARSPGPAARRARRPG